MAQPRTQRDIPPLTMSLAPHKELLAWGKFPSFAFWEKAGEAKQSFALGEVTENQEKPTKPQILKEKRKTSPTEGPAWEGSLAVLRRRNLQPAARESSPKAGGKQSRGTTDACQTRPRAPAAEPALLHRRPRDKRGLQPGAELPRQDESGQALAPGWRLHSPALASGLPQHLARLCVPPSSAKQDRRLHKRFSSSKNRADSQRDCHGLVSSVFLKNFSLLKKMQKSLEVLSLWTHDASRSCQQDPYPARRCL